MNALVWCRRGRMLIDQALMARRRMLMTFLRLFAFTRLFNPNAGAVTMIAAAEHAVREHVQSGQNGNQ